MNVEDFCLITWKSNPQLISRKQACTWSKVLNQDKPFLLKMHIVLFLTATLPSFCICQSAAFLQESAAVAEFIQSMAGPIPRRRIKNFCQNDTALTIPWKAVEYTCEMNAEGRVTKLSVVGVMENHRYPRDFKYLPRMCNFLRCDPRPRPAFNVYALRKLSSLTHLYTVFLTKALPAYWF